MRRRTFLVGLATGLAGCSAAPGRSTDTPTLTPVDPPSETPTRTPDDNGGDEDDDPPLWNASVVDLATGDRTLALAPPEVRAPDGAGVELVFEASATADHPARVTATLTNGNDWENTFRLREVPGFHDVNYTRLPYDGRPGDRETTLYLAPTSNHDLVDAEPSFERGPEGFWRETGERDAVPKLPSTVRLDPGESVTGEYVLLGHEDRRGFPTGTYEFGHGDASFRIAAWRSSAPGPGDDSRFSGRIVRPLPDAGSMAWYHTADETTPAYLQPSSERVEAPGRVAFTLVNHTREKLGGNPYRWGLYKLVDGEWFKIAPWMVPVPFSAVSPGGEFEYVLRTFHRDAVSCDGHDDGLARSVGHLGGGTYAFSAGFSRDNETHAALFELAAPPVEPALTGEATVTEEGTRTVVTMVEWDDGEHPPDARLVVRPVDASPERRFVSEQLMRQPYAALRNAMAVADSGQEVVVRTDEHRASRVVGHDAESVAFEYEGTVYEARVEHTVEDDATDEVETASG